MMRFTALVLATLCAGQVSLSAQDDLYSSMLEAGLGHLQSGKLNRARHEFEEVILDFEEAEEGDEKPSAEVLRACRQGLLRIDLITGAYDPVIASIDALEEAERELEGYALLRVEAALRRGRLDEARQSLDDLIARDSGNPEARCRLGELLLERGEKAAAEAQFKELIDQARRSSLRRAEDLTWVARAHMSLGSMEDLEQASALLVEAMRVSPDLAAPRILYGKLRFDAYGEWEGRESGESALQEVLKRNGEVEEALITLYLIRKTNHKLDPGKTESYLRRALDLNSNSVPAMLERGIQLIDDRRFAAGSQVLDQALSINPRHKAALAQRAAAAYLQGKDEESKSYRERISAIDASDVQADIALGDRLVRLYRFGDSISYFRSALETQPENLDALHGLARALIYTGQGKQAAEVLTKAEELQPGIVNPWRFNALAVEALLDDEYEMLESDGFIYRIHRDHRGVLESYLLPILSEAMETLGKKYEYRPEYPVVIEVLHTWDDFSVRTIGFRGFTALGACFGPMITLVSPADVDLRRQDFMWTATAWHEFAHVLTLALSSHRVPRWLTEGISVHEEGARNPSWERGMDRELLSMHRNGDIPPVRLLNSLFRGPRILEGYYLGGQIVDYLSREYGFDKVVQMLRYYGEDMSTEDAFQRAFGISTEVFDKAFLSYVEEEKLAKLIMKPVFGERAMSELLTRVARDPGDLQAHVDLAWGFLQRGVEVDAASHLREVLRVQPDHPEGKLVHAELFRRRGAEGDAIAAYEAAFAAGAEDFDSRIKYGRMLAARGDVDGAARQFQSAKRCWPGCTDQEVAPSVLLARLYAEAGRRTEAMMELKTFCSRTGRAFQPRLELAAFANAEGDRGQEARLLEEALEIDPFSRDVHLRLADAYLAQGRKSDALRELEVTLAISPVLDRANLGKPAAEIPRPDDGAYLNEQARICLRIAKLLRQLDRREKAMDYLQRILSEYADSSAADEAATLRERWR
ncbi:MAG: tetratricopeptide repeat protein [Planctomycetota bacterium]|jgi:tetratricopeptide (TPR) repeat protein